MMRLLLLLPVLGFFTGCGIFGGGTKTEELAPPPPVVVKPPAKPAPREPGSLWSEDSRWNEIYMFTPSRKVGDPIRIKVTDSLRFRIEQSLRLKNPEPKKEVTKIAQGPVKASDETVEAKPEFNDGAAKAKTVATPKKNDTVEVEGTILEVVSKGIYRIYANAPIVLGGSTPYVIMDGQVRERDIKPDDSTSSEAVFNLKVDAAHLASGTKVQRADGKMVEVPEETK